MTLLASSAPQGWTSAANGTEPVSSAEFKSAVGGLTCKAKLESFGRSFGRKYWKFQPGWINLNHGSYGAEPLPVLQAFRDLQDQASDAPDRYHRIEYLTKLEDTRKALADFVGCDVGDLVLVNNATVGVNDVLRSLTTEWNQGDKILYISTTVYNGCEGTLRAIVDSHRHLGLSLLPVEVTYPISHKDLIQAIKTTLEAEKAKGSKVRLALIDAISSNPGVIVPWEPIVKLLREYDVLSLIDAAHQIGQLPVNLRESQPDFWVSNCHKWLMAHRGVAVLYVAKRYQHLIHSIPSGLYYAPRDSSDELGAPGWLDEFVWNGTIDWSSYLSIPAALEFRKTICGGEERIYDYCHTLAKEGGREVAKILGTETMENLEGEGELVGTMSNVLLPLATPGSHLDAKEAFSMLVQQRTSVQMLQMTKHKTMVPAFIHNDKLWVRFSAQVYNDLEEFKEVGKILLDVCTEVEKGLGV
ncbi:PLP-dependent transferase [Meredithblackwellia eburnea MCA 4105]